MSVIFGMCFDSTCSQRKSLSAVKHAAIYLDTPYTRASMFTRSTAGAGRSVKSLFASPCISTHSYTVPIGEALSTRSRRHSSSKASCPPGGSRGSVPAADAGKSANDEKSSEAKEKRLASSRMARRRQKDNDFTADYPRAPSTSDIAPVGTSSSSQSTIRLC